MKRMSTMALMAAVPILGSVAAILAAPEAPWIPAKAKELFPYGSISHTAPCQPGGQTVALARGSQGTAIGLYVYGPDGQCIGSDDAPGELFDERIVPFDPVQSGPYEMSVRSYSGRVNLVFVSMRAGGRTP